RISTLLDGELSGGMTYKLDFRMGRDDDPGEPDDDDDPPKDGPQDGPKDWPPKIPDLPVRTRRPTMEEILKILRGEQTEGGTRGIRTMRLEIDFDGD
ncbi:MAG: hypothetical protein ACK4FR_10730, partial [Tabrizicola sp.]